MITSTKFDWIMEEGEKLAGCLHSDPFSFLGAHPHQNQWLIRAWMPEASKVDLLQNGKTYAMSNKNRP